MSVFSNGDLASIASLIRTKNINTDKFAATLATLKGTYLAITIKDPQKFLDKFYSESFTNNKELPVVDTPEHKKFLDCDRVLAPVINKYFSMNNKDRIINETNIENKNVLQLFLGFLQLMDAGINVFELDSNFNVTKKLN